MLPIKCLGRPRTNRTPSRAEIRAVLPGLARPTRSPSVVQQPDDAARRASGATGRRARHFHAVLERVRRLASPSVNVDARAAPAAGRGQRNQPRGKRFARRSGAHRPAGPRRSSPNSPDRVRRSAVRTAPHSQRLAEVVRQRAHVEPRRHLHLQSRAVRRRTPGSRAATPSPSPASDRAWRRPRPPRQVVGTLAVDVLRGVSRRRLLEGAAELRERRDRAASRLGRRSTSATVSPVAS